MSEDLPPGWAWAELGCIADTQLGKTLNRSKQTGEATTPYLRNLNIRWGSFDLNAVNRMDIFPEESEQFTVQNGDLLLTEGGEPGRCAVWRLEERFGFQNALHRIRPAGRIRPEFLQCQFEWLTKTGQLAHLFSGVTIKHFSQSKLRSVKIRLPPLAEQGRIVPAIEEHFSRLDAAETAAQTALTKLDMLRRAVLAAAFSGRHTDDWKWAELGEICTEIKGQISPKSGSIYDLYSVPAFPTGLPERIDGDEIKSGKREIQPGNLLICKINPRINRVWIVGDSEGLPQIASTEYLVIRPHEPNVGAFIRWYLSSPSFRKWIVLSVEGVTGSHTRAKSRLILKQPIPLPPLAEQQRIVAAIEEHFSRIDAAESALQKLLEKVADLRRSILAAAFSGQLVPQDPDDEPASVLLERIVAERPKRRTRRAAPAASFGARKQS